MSENKSLTGVEIKDADKGIVQAVFATLDVIDKDGDVTVPGAFEDGAEVRISAFGHKSWEGALPVGKGVIRAGDTEAVLEGRFFLNTQHGRDTFETVKEMGGLQEWSYGFDIVEADAGERDGKAVRVLKKLKVHEVSPVLLGAGVGTRTLAIKGEEPAGFFIPMTSNTTVTSVRFGKSDLPFSEQAERVLGDVRTLLDRAKAFGSQTADERKEGRVLSSANRERLLALASSLGEVHGELQTLLSETDPDKPMDDLLRELARFERSRASL